MKSPAVALFAFMAATIVPATQLQAQPGGPGGGGEERGGRGDFRARMMRLMPVIAALDADGNGVISKEEIANAAVALRTLDKDEDGKLSEDELRPDLSSMFGGGGGESGGRPGGERGDRGSMVERMMERDANNDGKLTGDELPEFMQDRLSTFDTNEDGAIDTDELEAMANRSGGGGGGGRGPGGPGGGGNFDPAQFVERIFSENDANEDGKLTGDEIPDRMKDRVADIDTDKDGAVSRAELEERFRSSGGRPPGPGAGPDAANGPREGAATEGAATEGGDRPARPKRPEPEPE